MLLFSHRQDLKMHDLQALSWPLFPQGLWDQDFFQKEAYILL